MLSPSTRNYDRSSKFAHYRSIVSLQDYVLIDPESVLIEHYHRLKQNEWLLRVYSQLSDVLNLVTLDIHIPLSELYA